MMHKIEIKTRDGLGPSFVFRPAGSGPWPRTRYWPTYPANYGWVFRDMPVSDAASERHWQTLLALFDATLRT